MLCPLQRCGLARKTVTLRNTPRVVRVSPAATLAHNRNIAGVAPQCGEQLQSMFCCDLTFNAVRHFVHSMLRAMRILCRSLLTGV